MGVVVLEEGQLKNPATAMEECSEDMDIDGCCYVSAPSSPGHRHMAGGDDGYYFYSAPASPTHFAAILPRTTTTTTTAGESNPNPSSSAFDFHFSTFNPEPNSSSSSSSSSSMMSSADELFFNGQIRPMKQHQHILTPLVESNDNIDVQEQEEMTLMSHDLNREFRAGRITSLPRRTRSMSPNRSLNKDESIEEEEDEGKACRSNETTLPVGRSTSSRRRWVFLKEFLYRSKSEGSSSTRNNRNANINVAAAAAAAAAAAKDKKRIMTVVPPNEDIVKLKNRGGGGGGDGGGKTKRRVPNYELHYAAKRAEAVAMRKKTFLPYRQGGLLLGCLGFSSWSFGANINGGGFARAAAGSFNTIPAVSSR